MGSSSSTYRKRGHIFLVHKCIFRASDSVIHSDIARAL